MGWRKGEKGGGREGKLVYSGSQFDYTVCCGREDMEEGA